ncbi:dsDNA nuclease domain-containing protein [Marinomonas ostreistagni]|uniref:DUF4297 domain-containing protein n=1 Tax=Marinomonas ostreistagni TaxID=359209 RepID=A0ABS0Z764_9GAMM|nr:dsDNA nuclease domain-containing protein [Marinomonas ostreistagni]MBJ7549523.1 DUF4297 domain-containing protein [Marinomonas ostreistagni]
MSKLLTQTYDLSDPGDDMQLRVRYQHGYGLILFCEAEKKEIDCKSLWFEHLEDILLEKNNGKFNFYQVKTREPTLGKWKMSDEALVKSIKRFCEFEAEYGDSTDRFFFVSNCPYRETQTSTKEEEKALSPINFFRKIKSLKTGEELDGEFKKRFEVLIKSVGLEGSILIRVIQKTSLVVGPPLENFELELSVTHLLSISAIKDRGLTYINRVRDEFLHKIFKASSLSIEDTHKHIFCMVDEKKYDPRVLSKKIDLESFSEFISSAPKDVFMYFENSAELELGSSIRDMEILRRKVKRAGLSSQYESLKRRALSTEGIFLEEAIKNPEEFQSMLDQVEGSVLSVCSDAILDATNGQAIDGVEAFRSARKKLEYLSNHNPAQVSSQSSDCLIGVAGLLTGACKLWWSEEFDMDEEK